MKFFTGAIVLILGVCCIVLTGVLVYAFFTGDAGTGEFVSLPLILICTFCLLHYPVSTRFWTEIKKTTAEKLEEENQIIRKQIEQKELLARLENTEKK